VEFVGNKEKTRQVADSSWKGRAEDHMQEQDPLWLLIIAILNLFRRDSRNIEALVGIASRSF
jgi:hypothetical protein